MVRSRHDVKVAPYPSIEGDRKLLRIKLPGRADLELPAYYEEFADDYPTAELATKHWFCYNVQRDWVCIDAGAHIGYYTVLLSQLAPWGHVHAVEPTKTVNMLGENLAYHGCQNVTVHNVALGRREGRFKEKVCRLWGPHATKPVPEERVYNFTTLDRLVPRLKLPRLDLVKIDVDSFDLDVLMGAEETLRVFDPWVLVELNDGLKLRGHSRDKALGWLKKHGYTCALVLDGENYVLRRGIIPMASAPYCYGVSLV